MGAKNTTNSEGVVSGQGGGSAGGGGRVTDLDKLRGIRWHIAGNCGTGAFCTLTVFGSVFVLFMDALGFDKTRIGVLLSVIPFSTVLALFVAPWTVRMGLKRVFLWGFGVRNIVIALLLFTPLLVNHYGAGAGFIWVAMVMVGFSLCRAVAETAFMAWYPELIPKTMRGRFSAINTTITMVATIAAVLAASVVIKRFDSVEKFGLLIGVGVIAGLAGAWCYSKMPGGRPVRRESRDKAHIENLRACLHDRNFLVFLGACVLAWLGTSAVFPFIALYMKEQIGLASDKVVLLEACSYVGILLSSYLCGWLADRYGSRPLLLLSAGMFVLLPVLWFLMPRGYTWCLYPAMSISVLAGVTGTLWGIAYGRYFYNTVVPDEMRSAYTSIWCACAGLVGGTAPLLAGLTLDRCRGIEGKIWIFNIDSYSPLFGVCVLCLCGAVALLRRAHSDSTISTGRFVGMFFRGNAVAAMSSLVRFRLAGDETQRLASTKGMARAQNPLNVEELVEALHDPSFNVRYEAIISIANARPDRRLVEALVGVLNSGEADLAPTAAWALGKLGDRSAVGELRKSLVSDYPVMRARGARALEMLGDRDSIAYLCDGLEGEIEPAVRVAYVVALARLGERSVLGALLNMLRGADDETVRSELSLATARIVGNERHYTRLWRNVRRDVATTSGQMMLALGKEFRKRRDSYGQLLRLASECAQEFAEGELENGIAVLVELIGELRTDEFEDAAGEVISECAASLGEFGSSRREYIVLALHTLNVQVKRFGPDGKGRDSESGA